MNDIVITTRKKPDVQQVEVRRCTRLTFADIYGSRHIYGRTFKVVDNDESTLSMTWDMSRGIDRTVLTSFEPGGGREISRTEPEIQQVKVNVRPRSSVFSSYHKYDYTAVEAAMWAEEARCIEELFEEFAECVRRATIRHASE